MGRILALPYPNLSHSNLVEATIKREKNGLPRRGVPDGALGGSWDDIRNSGRIFPCVGSGKEEQWRSLFSWVVVRLRRWFPVGIGAGRALFDVEEDGSGLVFVGDGVFWRCSVASSTGEDEALIDGSTIFDEASAGEGYVFIVKRSSKKMVWCCRRLEGDLSWDDEATAFMTSLQDGSLRWFVDV